MTPASKESEMERRVREIREREEKATKGPWYAEEKRVYGTTDVKTWDIVRDDGSDDTLIEGGWAKEEDAVFISKARIDIPFLLSALSALQGENERIIQKYDALAAKIRMIHVQEKHLAENCNFPLCKAIEAEGRA